ncbi:VanZ family protein [Thalassobacillus hwangdonensis]|uniref:VanZ family protein n=1 Tax=Thalassobacillus hwangdonensis TaxID=546108 RepID=A0ABW3L2D8_9BACI
MKNSLYWWLAPIAWMGVIFYASSQPYQEQDLKPFLSNYIDVSFLAPYLDWIRFTYHHSEVSVAELGTAGFIEFFIRKGAHVTVFMILFLLFYLALTKSAFQKPILTALTLTVLYAALDEMHQGMTPNRTPYIGDVVLDTIGALIGVGLILLISKRKKDPISKK